MNSKFIPVLTQYFNDAGGVPDPERIFYDTFTGTNFTLLSAHTPDVDDASDGWSVNGNQAQLYNGNAQATGGLPTDPPAVVMTDTGKADVRIVTAVKGYAAGYSYAPFALGVAFRGWFNTDQCYLLVANGDDNKWYFGIYDTSLQNFVGTPSEYSTTINSQYYDVIIDVIGSDCTISIDGTERFSETLANTTQTKHGIYLIDYEDSGTDFEILELFG